MSQKFTDWDATASNNTTVGTGAIDIDENCAPGNVNDALREIMAACVRSSGLPGLSGTSRPAGTQAGQFWFDTTTATAPVIKFYDGTDDISFATVDYTANTITFSGAVVTTPEIANDVTPQLGGNLDVNGFSIVSASNGDITIEPDGTGDIILAADDIGVEEDIYHIGDVDNKITFGTDTQNYQTGGSSRIDLSDSGVRLGGANARVTTILDEDDMASDSATALATQQSIKAYVDTKGVDVWANWDGNPVSINASAGVSSITDLGTGLYRVNFSSAFSDANYASVGMAEDTSSNADVNCSVDTQTTSRCDIVTRDDGANALWDPNSIHCIFVR